MINAHPGVSHNYRRNHEFNMWFTVAMPPGHDLDAVIQRLHVLSGAESTRPMPTLRLFKIGVTLDMAGDRDTVARGAPEYSEERREEATAPHDHRRGHRVHPRDAGRPARRALPV